jgi:hypothetical protein
MAQWFNKSANTIHNIDGTVYGSLRSQGRHVEVAPLSHGAAIPFLESDH